MSDTKFDHDPEALAWARAKVEAFVKKMREFEKQASHAEPPAPERVRQWRVCANLAESHFIGGEGCVIAAFDERLPKVLDAFDSASVAGGQSDA